MHLLLRAIRILPEWFSWIYNQNWKRWKWRHGFLNNLGTYIFVIRAALCYELQGLQAQRVLFDFQITGSKSITFDILKAFFKSRQKHNFDDRIDFHETP